LQGQTLTKLAKMGATEQQNATFIYEWANLLKSMGLEDLTQQPVIGEAS
jgi:Domain of Unknown Function (DUF928)